MAGVLYSPSGHRAYTAIIETILEKHCLGYMGITLMSICANNVLIHCQILTSVQQRWMIATNRPLVWTQLMVVTPVHATLDTLEMDKSAKVNGSLNFPAEMMPIMWEVHLKGCLSFIKTSLVETSRETALLIKLSPLQICMLCSGNSGLDCCWVEYAGKCVFMPIKQV